MDVGMEGSSDNSRPVFNVGLTWSGIPDLTLRATFAQGFRAPSLQEKYIVSSMGGGTILPNPGLKPETSNSYEIGARYVHGGLSVDVAAFYSDADDYIYNSTINAAEQLSRYVNVSSAKTHGWNWRRAMILKTASRRMFPRHGCGASSTTAR